MRPVFGSTLRDLTRSSAVESSASRTRIKLMSVPHALRVCTPSECIPSMIQPCLPASAAIFSIFFIPSASFSSLDSSETTLTVGNTFSRRLHRVDLPAPGGPTTATRKCGVVGFTCSPWPKRLVTERMKATASGSLFSSKRIAPYISCASISDGSKERDASSTRLQSGARFHGPSDLANCASLTACSAGITLEGYIVSTSPRLR
mmetsp:Transcript_19538/g.39571  ORF Transcript_19538/g.39571 Transcript_19538/m.39571 type:complete len:204 (-) Transcript_19538:1876-2487(-)